jgi:hypothetical protein
VPGSDRKRCPERVSTIGLHNGRCLAGFGPVIWARSARCAVLLAATLFIFVLCLGRAACTGPGMSRPKAFGRGDVQFITQYLWDTRVSLDLRSKFGAHRRPARDQPACRKVKVMPIAEDQAHPAAGQFGLFAAQTLSPGEHILDYLGFVTTEEHCADSEYVASLAPGLLCDAEKFGNEARFVNDFHGTGKNPNVRFERRVDENTGEARLGIHVMKRKIRKGEELLISYGHCYSFA